MAKFKVGDEVKISTTDPTCRYVNGERVTVLREMPKKVDGDTVYEIKIPGGPTLLFKEWALKAVNAETTVSDKPVSTNAVVRNAVMANDCVKNAAVARNGKTIKSGKSYIQFSDDGDVSAYQFVSGSRGGSMGSDVCYDRLNSEVAKVYGQYLELKKLLQMFNREAGL